MKVKKITTGFVIQEYDTELGKWISQEFIAGDRYNLTPDDLLVEWEDENGECVDSVDDAYLPFDMIQPDRVQRYTSGLKPFTWKQPLSPAEAVAQLREAAEKWQDLFITAPARKPDQR